jgi:hypothetical protein
MKYIYFLLSRYHAHVARWLRRQVIICECRSNFWSFKARGFKVCYSKSGGGSSSGFVYPDQIDVHGNREKGR